jgi:hypothetical protein
LVPCMHADPVLADCLTGQTVRVLGRLWFYEGSDIDSEIARAQKTFVFDFSGNGSDLRTQLSYRI